MSKTLDHMQREERWLGIPATLRNISRDNVILHDILSRYISGQIVTWEECLCQAVVALTTNYDKLIQDYVQYRVLCQQPLIP